MQREFEKNPKAVMCVTYSIVDDLRATSQKELVTISTLNDLLRTINYDYTGAPRKGIIKAVDLAG